MNNCKNKIHIWSKNSDRCINCNISKEEFVLQNESKISIAIKFAENAHKNQKRKYTNEPYFVHCEAVAEMVKDQTNDEDVVCAAYLHDTVEDCGVTYEQIEELFGQRVADLVKELTDVYTKENYPNLNRFSRKKLEAERLWTISKEAKLIKRCDIQNNLSDIIINDKDFGRVFLQEKEYILKGF